MKLSSINTEDLNIQIVPSFIGSEMVQAEVYDFDISPTMNRGGSVPEPSMLTGIELDLRTKRQTGRAFGSELLPETFEGEAAAIGLVAGAIIVVALVAGGAYLTFQAQKAMELGGAILAPGISIAESVVEAVAPKESVKDPPE